MASQLKGVGALLLETWEQYKVQSLPILGVLLCILLLILLVMHVELTLFSMLLILLKGGVGPSMTPLQSWQDAPILLLHVVFVVVAVPFFVLLGWSSIMAIVVNKGFGLNEALRVGWRMMWSMGWVLMLSSGIIMAGALILVIPGLIFFIWFMFAVFILYAEDRHGFDALFASRAYVRGHWWNILFKFYLVWLFNLLIGLIPMVGPILCFLFTPFLLLFIMALYRDLKEAYGDKPVQGGSRFLWGSLAIIGLLLPFLGIAWPL